jgi:hypothetical protein
MPYQWSVDTSDCDSRFGDFTAKSLFHDAEEAHTLDWIRFPARERRLTFSPLRRVKAPTYSQFDRPPRIVRVRAPEPPASSKRTRVARPTC